MEITGYRFGRLAIGSEVHTKDLIILPDVVVPGWWRKHGHRLLTEDLEEVFAAGPRTLVIGTGAFGMMKVPDTTLEEIRRRGIEPLVMRTKDACGRFNELASGGGVAAALHLTC